MNAYNNKEMHKIIIFIKKKIKSKEESVLMVQEKLPIS